MEPYAEHDESETVPVRILDTTTGEWVESTLQSHGAVLLGRVGGRKGGHARAKNLSAAERKEIAKKAARARWATAQV
jgi:hypothetical protein